MFDFSSHGDTYYDVIMSQRLRVLKKYFPDDLRLVPGMPPDEDSKITFFLETDRTSGSFGGGRFAPPVAFA